VHDYTVLLPIITLIMIIVGLLHGIFVDAPRIRAEQERLRAEHHQTVVPPEELLGKSA